MRIGMDFDNTLVCYDRLFKKLALEAGYMVELLPDDKQGIRDLLRRQKNGEIHWQQLQSLAYGPRIGEAELFPGVIDVLAALKKRGDRLFVVSHKSRYAAQKNGGIDLREAAQGYLAGCSLFKQGLLDPRQVFFETTRAEKIARIVSLGCDLFIDDLWETFSEEGFPQATRPVLFAPKWQQGPQVQCASWQQIGEMLELP